MTQVQNLHQNLKDTHIQKLHRFGDIEFVHCGNDDGGGGEKEKQDEEDNVDDEASDPPGESSHWQMFPAGEQQSVKTLSKGHSWPGL